MKEHDGDQCESRGKGPALQRPRTQHGLPIGRRHARQHGMTNSRKWHHSGRIGLCTLCATGRLRECSFPRVKPAIALLIYVYSIFYNRASYVTIVRDLDDTQAEKQFTFDHSFWSHDDFIEDPDSGMALPSLRSKYIYYISTSKAYHLDLVPICEEFLAVTLNTAPPQFLYTYGTMRFSTFLIVCIYNPIVFFFTKKCLFLLCATNCRSVGFYNGEEIEEKSHLRPVRCGWHLDVTDISLGE